MKSIILLISFFAFIIQTTLAFGNFGQGWLSTFIGESDCASQENQALKKCWEYSGASCQIQSCSNDPISGSTLTTIRCAHSSYKSLMGVFFVCGVFILLYFSIWLSTKIEKPRGEHRYSRL